MFLLTMHCLWSLGYSARKVSLESASPIQTGAWSTITHASRKQNHQDCMAHHSSPQVLPKIQNTQTLSHYFFGLSDNHMLAVMHHSSPQISPFFCPWSPRVQVTGCASRSYIPCAAATKGTLSTTAEAKPSMIATKASTPPNQPLSWNAKSFNRPQGTAFVPIL